LKTKINIFNSLSLYIFILIVILASYFYGFFVKEDSSGGGKIDFNLHIYNNFILFYSNDFFKINWSLYDSTSLPLHYILSKIILLNESKYQYQVFWFSFSFFGFLFFYLMLLEKFDVKNKISIQTLILASTILLSPYFRTSAFWGLEENIGIILLVITLYFYLSYKNTNKFYFFIGTIFFASLTFYSRQSYLFLPIIIFILLLEKSSYFKRENILLTLMFVLFLLPTFYFFYEWDGLVPPMAQKRSNSFNLNNIPTILNIYLVYLIPFILKYMSFSKINLNYASLIKKNLKLNYIFVIGLLFLIYFLIFSDYNWTSNGSGILPKLLKMFFVDDRIVRIILLISSYITIILILTMFSKSIELILYFFINLIIFCLIDVIFQEYFDPICLIMLLCFSPKKFLTKTNFDLAKIIPTYSGIILIGSIIYHS